MKYGKRTWNHGKQTGVMENIIGLKTTIIGLKQQQKILGCPRLAQPCACSYVVNKGRKFAAKQCKVYNSVQGDDPRVLVQITHKFILPNTSSTRTKRGGSCLTIRPFSSIELACAVHQPGPCMCALCEAVAVLSSSPIVKNQSRRGHHPSSFHVWEGKIRTVPIPSTCPWCVLTLPIAAFQVNNVRRAGQEPILRWLRIIPGWERLPGGLEVNTMHACTYTGECIHTYIYIYICTYYHMSFNDCVNVCNAMQCAHACVITLHHCINMRQAIQICTSMHRCYIPKWSYVHTYL